MHPQPEVSHKEDCVGRECMRLLWTSCNQGCSHMQLTGREILSVHGRRGLSL